MNSIELVICDWNGTSLNDLPNMYGSVCAIFKQYDVPPPTFDEYRQEITSDFLGFYHNHGLHKTITADDLNIIRKKFLQEHWDSVDLQDGLIELLEECKGTGLKTAIVSGELSDVLVRRLKQFNIGYLIDDVCGEACDKTKALRETAEHLKTPLGKAIYIDDTFDGLTCARAIGMQTCGYTNGYNTPDRIIAACPTYIVHSLHELIPIITGGV